MIRPPLPNETPGLIALGNATGVFQPDEAEALLGGVLSDLQGGRLGDGHQVQVWADGPDDSPAGWVYFAPAALADGVWDLWWIGVAPTRQGEGIGGKLLRFVENQVRAVSGRLLLIETSSQPKLDPTRRFYAQGGYAECGRVPNFYAEGDDKLIYGKPMVARIGAEG